MPEFIRQLNATKFLMLLPVMDFISALLFLIPAARKYLIILVVAWVFFIIIMTGAYANPYIHTISGEGEWLATIAALLLSFLCFPLALAEDMILNPERDIFAGFMGEA